MVGELFGVASFLCAGFAAWQWGVASRVPLPPSTSNSWEGVGPFTDALKRQSRLNSHAAFSAGLAALFQALSMFFQIGGLPTLLRLLGLS